MDLFGDVKGLHMFFAIGYEYLNGGEDYTWLVIRNVFIYTQPFI
jgi:hypothetical protein